MLEVSTRRLEGKERVQTAKTPKNRGHTGFMIMSLTGQPDRVKWRAGTSLAGRSVLQLPRADGEGRE